MFVRLGVAHQLADATLEFASAPVGSLAADGGVDEPKLLDALVWNHQGGRL